MPKVFHVTAVCVPEKHYMVNLDSRLRKIKALVDDGSYFTVNRARQYGKTTTLLALEQFLQAEYAVVFIDFQTISSAKFQNEHTFSTAFAKEFLRGLKGAAPAKDNAYEKAVRIFAENVSQSQASYELPELFEDLREVCATADKPLVLILDETDQAADHQVFLDFLAQLRAGYIRRAIQPAFWSVILAGVYDIKNLKRKFRTDETHHFNSPWNIAADFTVEMGFSEDDIAGMLLEYESDYHTGMDVRQMAELVYHYTCGYPYLVSRLCKLMDEEVSMQKAFGTKSAVWTKRGLLEAVRMILTEKNTLFESLIGKLLDFPELNVMLRSLLFSGKGIVFNPDEPAMDIALMFGFMKKQQETVAVANRIFETRLYNYYLSAAEMQELDLYKTSLQDKNQFLVHGYLNMRLVLEKFVVHFHDLYGTCEKAFIEEVGRKYFLLYLMPIINGTGNYYVESQTRDLCRTDVIVDYRGEQYIIEMKIWRGDEYHKRGEKQLIGYLEHYHTNKGYLLSFNFNQKKQVGVHEIVVGDKVLIEAVM